MKNKLSSQLEREIESATRKIFGYGIKSVKKGSTSQADSKERLEQKQRIVTAIEQELDRKREDIEKEIDKNSFSNSFYRFGKQFKQFVAFCKAVANKKKIIIFAPDYVVMDWETYRKMKPNGSQIKVTYLD